MSWKVVDLARISDAKRRAPQSPLLRRRSVRLFGFADPLYKNRLRL